MASTLQNLAWVEELLPEDYLRKRMFGGFSYYIEEKLYLVIFESEGHKEYRGKKFDFEIWNGCMFPVEKENHVQVFQQFPFLIHHPVLPKWLYVPQETEEFESHVRLLMREIRNKNILFGTYPVGKSKDLKKVKKGSDKSADEIKTKDIKKYLLKTPKMFSDEPAEKVLEKARKISDFKNLGPETEKGFHKAGIKSPQQFIKLGWKKTMIKLCEADSRSYHSILAYAVIGALKNKMWSQISEEDKLEARQFIKSLRDQAKAKTKNKGKSKSKRKS